MEKIKNRKGDLLHNWIIGLLIGLGFLAVALILIYIYWGIPTIDILKSFLRRK